MITSRFRIAFPPQCSLSQAMPVPREYSGFPFASVCVKMEKMSFPLGKATARGADGRGAPMKECVIFCAAEFNELARPVSGDTFVLAADGGLRHTQRLGIAADAVIGDFDSLGFAPEGANVFPVEKDDTDAMLAVRLGLARGCGEFLIYGGLDGPRLDHTVANFQVLQFFD